jgi:hypothetical protein
VIDCCKIDLFGCNGGDPIVAFEQCVLRDGVMRAREYPFVGDSDSCLYDNSNLAFSPQDYAIVPPNNNEQLLMVFKLNIIFWIGCSIITSFSLY